MKKKTSDSSVFNKGKYQTRYFVLDIYNTEFKYTKSPDKKGKIIPLREIRQLLIPYKDKDLMADKNFPYTFRLDCYQRQYSFGASTRAERDMWVKGFNVLFDFRERGHLIGGNVSKEVKGSEELEPQVNQYNFEVQPPLPIAGVEKTDESDDIPKPVHTSPQEMDQQPNQAQLELEQRQKQIEDEKKRLKLQDIIETQKLKITQEKVNLTNQELEVKKVIKKVRLKSMGMQQKSERPTNLNGNAQISKELRQRIQENQKKLSLNHSCEVSPKNLDKMKTQTFQQFKLNQTPERTQPDSPKIIPSKTTLNSYDQSPKILKGKKIQQNYFSSSMKKQDKFDLIIDHDSEEDVEKDQLIDNVQVFQKTDNLMVSPMIPNAKISTQNYSTAPFNSKKFSVDFQAKQTIFNNTSTIDSLIERERDSSFLDRIERKILSNLKQNSFYEKSLQLENENTSPNKAQRSQNNDWFDEKPKLSHFHATITVQAEKHQEKQDKFDYDWDSEDSQENTHVQAKASRNAEKLEVHDSFQEVWD